MDSNPGLLPVGQLEVLQRTVLVLAEDVSGLKVFLNTAVSDLFRRGLVAHLVGRLLGVLNFEKDVWL